MEEKKKFKIMINGKIQEWPEGTTYEDIAKANQKDYDALIVAVIADNKLKELFKRVKKDCKLEFVTLKTLDGERIYARSLIFVADVAVRKLFEKYHLYVHCALNGGLYCSVKGKKLKEQEIKKIEDKMKELVEQDLPFIKVKVTKQRALKAFEQAGLYDKIDLFNTVPRDTISIYYLDNFVNYFYGHLVPSTGYLKKFKLHPYKDGFILLYPRWQHWWDVVEFKETKNLAKVYEEYENWLKILGIEKISDINRAILDGSIRDLILTSEALQEQKISLIAKQIWERRDKVKVVLIAGPSSSGKTTFSKRLTIHLKVTGLEPIPISLDDYFLDREKTPRDENGNYDWESIYALNLDLLNKHLNMLFAGKEVELPYYDFKEGKSKKSGRVIKLPENGVLILEGIHGLNDTLTKDIDDSKKFKIYISPLTQLHIDDTNRIPTTDTRLIRRLVRDFKYRGHSVFQTLKMWPMVRRGEEKNIFPYQENADAYFNSALVYELAVLKKYATPILAEVNRDSIYYSEAKRLLRFLGYFLPIEDERPILANSIMREFIGGSCYNY